MLTHTLKQPAWRQVMGDMQWKSRIFPFISLIACLSLSSFWLTHHTGCQAAVHTVTWTWAKGSRDKPRFPELGVAYLGEYRETELERNRGTPGGTIFWFLFDSLSLSVQVASRMQIKMKKGEWKELRQRKNPGVREWEHCRNAWVSMNIYQLSHPPSPSWSRA